MDINKIIQRIDNLVEQGIQVLKTLQKSEYSARQWVDYAKMTGFRTASLSFISQVYGETHSYYTAFDGTTRGSTPNSASAGIEILKAIRDEISGGWLFSIKGLIAAEIFSDFIEMAEHLLTSGYKDPAAVMVGSVLEEHLRQLCIKKGIEVNDNNDKPKKADRLNSDLVKNNIYTKLDLKNVTAWLDLRNKAAHGHYSEYTEDQVTNMMAGVTEFISRVSIDSI